MVPKSQDARRYTFDYQNLLAVCSGTVSIENDNTKDDKGRQTKSDDRHCNNKKDDKPIEKDGIPVVITPLQDDCEDKFTFDIDGKIDGIDEIANQSIALLGLNSPILVRACKNSILKFRYPYHYNKMLQISSKDIQQELANIRTTKDGKYEPFFVANEQVLRNLLDS